MSDKTDFETELRNELDPQDGSEKVSAFLLRLSTRTSLPIDIDRDRLRRIASLFDDNEQALQEKKARGHIKPDETDVEFLTRLSDRPSWYKDRPRLRRMVEYLKRIDEANAIFNGVVLLNKSDADFVERIGRLLLPRHLDRERLKALGGKIRMALGFVERASAKTEDSPAEVPDSPPEESGEWARVAVALRSKLPGGLLVYTRSASHLDDLRVLIPNASLRRLTRDNAAAVERGVMAFAERMRTLIGGPIPTPAAARARGADWECPECGIMNIADGLRCWHCETERPARKPGDGIGVYVPPPPADGVYPPLPELCQETNTAMLGMLGAGKTLAGRALAAAAEARRIAAYGGDPQAVAYAATHAAAAAGAQLTDVGPMVAEAVHEAGRTREYREGDKWRCIQRRVTDRTTCGAVNRADVTNCWRCTTAKPDAPTLFSETSADDWKCPGCDSMQCNWITSASSELRTICTNCGSPRPTVVEGMTTAGVEARYGSSLNGVTASRPADGDPLPNPSDSKPPAWDCGRCGKTNSVDRSACWSCGIDAKAIVAYGTEGDVKYKAWRCNCGAGNQVTSGSCWKCGDDKAAGKPYGPEVAASVLVHAWTCRCGVDNSTSRDKCWSCDVGRWRAKSDPERNGDDLSTPRASGLPDWDGDKFDCSRDRGDGSPRAVASQAHIDSARDSDPEF